MALLVSTSRRIIYCFRLEDRILLRNCETHKTTRRYILKDGNLNIYSSGNFKSHIVLSFFIVFVYETETTGRQIWISVKGIEARGILLISRFFNDAVFTLQANDKTISVLNLFTPWRRKGEWRYNSRRITSARGGGVWWDSRPGRLVPGEWPVTDEDGVDAANKRMLRLCWESIPDSQVVLFVVNLPQHEVN
jgi:hypothetical protein